jgi:hypothetical protein
MAILLAVVSLRPDPNSDLGIKGGASFQVYALRGEAVFPVRADTRLAPGDRIRFVVDPGNARYLLVASVDGAGKVSVYYPPSGDRSGYVVPGRSELEGSIELDQVLGPERLLAYFSDDPLPSTEVVESLARGAEAPRGIQPVVLTYIKEGR